VPTALTVAVAIAQERAFYNDYFKAGGFKAPLQFYQSNKRACQTLSALLRAVRR
jgi:hypothetical protein